MSNALQQEPAIDLIYVRFVPIYFASKTVNRGS